MISSKSALKLSFTSNLPDPLFFSRKFSGFKGPCGKVTLFRSVDQYPYREKSPLACNAI
jgi:hypothetical protein